MTDWQPIETAPKDGRQFYCGWFYRGRFIYEIGKVRTWESGQSSVVHGRSSHLIYPTHWMPLPPPPTEDNEQ